MAIVERVKALQLPLDQIVVIGSGLLDALGFREASDIDLVVSSQLFDALRLDERFTIETRFGEEMLLNDSVEIYQTWFAPYDEIKADAMELDGVYFVSPQRLLAFKKLRRSEKDQRDVPFLERYLNER